MKRFMKKSSAHPLRNTTFSYPPFLLEIVVIILFASSNIINNLFVGFNNHLQGNISFQSKNFPKKLTKNFQKKGKFFL